MKKLTAIALISLFFSATASAQQPPAPLPPAPPTDAPAVPAAPPEGTPPPPPADLAPLPPPAAPPEEAAATASAGEKMADVEGKLDGLNETLVEVKNTASILNKLKFSGYIQGRYEKRDDSISGVDSRGRVTNFDRFLVRRGRLKVVYNGENAEYLLQIDAVGDGVTLKDAEATFIDTWTPLGFRLTMGQFKVPFGYEILQSSGDREMPERARVIRALFPNERDRGVRLNFRYDWLKFSGALVNGNFTTDPVFIAFDQNRFFDAIGRIGGDFGSLVVGVSGQVGQKLGVTLPAAAAASGTDKDGDGTIKGDEIVFTPAGLPTIRKFNLWRVGADAQFYYDIAGVGGGALKGELVLGAESNQNYRGVAADPCRDLKQFGWILTGIQNFGDYWGVVARLDVWNPNRDVAAGTSATCTAAGTLAANDKITTLGGGPLFYISANLKASAIYEHVWRSDTLGSTNPNIAPSAWVPNDLLTLQLQAKF